MMHNGKSGMWALGFGILALGALGYAAMRLLADGLPMDRGSNSIYLAVTLAFIFIGLFVPYLMLKGGFKWAHMNDAREKEISLEDLPKDKQQMGRR